MPPPAVAAGNIYVKAGGVLTAIVGGVGYVAAGSKYQHYCQGTNHRSVTQGRQCAAGSFLVKEKEADKSAQKTWLGVAGAGIGIFILGYALPDKEIGNFRFYSIDNGLAIEKEGISFSATYEGGIGIRKSWVID